MAKKDRNLSQEQIKIRILAYPYNKGEVGANGYVIQHRANISRQEYNRFKGFLEDLCTKLCLEKYEEETAGEKTRINYKITNKGRDVINKYRDPLLQENTGGC